MPIPVDYLIYGATFLFAILLVEGLYFFLSDLRSDRNAVNRRMRMLSGKEDAGDVFLKLRRPDPESWKKFGILGDPLSALNRLVLQTGLTIKTGRIILYAIAGSVMLFIVLILVLEKKTAIQIDALIVSGVAFGSLALGLGGMLLYLMTLKSRRKKRFSESFPDALDVIVRSLRVGHPISVSLGLAARQMPDPIGTELGLVVDEVTYGLDLTEALQNMSERVDVEDFRYFVVAVSIQRETGGNLAEVLGSLAAVIRSRFRMFKKVRALAAEGKFSAQCLSVLPPAFGIFTFSVNPEYYLNVSDEALFWKIGLLAITLQLIGIFAMYKMINFRI
jgi:tight adherence protein B